MTRTNHSPSGGNATGREARMLPAFDRMLTNRTTSGRDGSAPNGFSVSRRMRSWPSQSTTSAWNGSFRSNSARNFARDPGLRTTNVPAAPTFTTSKLLSSLARMLGRNVRCPPTLTPRRKTMSAIPGLQKTCLRQHLQEILRGLNEHEAKRAVPYFSDAPLLRSEQKLGPRRHGNRRRCTGSSVLP